MLGFVTRKDRYVRHLEHNLKHAIELEQLNESLSVSNSLIKKQNETLIETNEKFTKSLVEKDIVIKNVSSGKWHLPKNEIMLKKAVKSAENVRKIYQNTLDMIEHYDEITGVIYCSGFKEDLINSYEKRIEEEQIALMYGFIVENQLTSVEIGQKFKEIQSFLDLKNIEMGR